jgi:hypothetical protein
MKKWKIKLENRLLKKISNAVVVEDIIKAKPVRDTFGRVIDIKFYLKGKELNLLDLKNLREEVKYLKETMIWKILTNSLKEEARKSMNENALNFDDMRQGKLLLYAISLQEKIIDKLK